MQHLLNLKKYLRYQRDLHELFLKNSFPHPTLVNLLD